MRSGGAFTTASTQSSTSLRRRAKVLRAPTISAPSAATTRSVKSNPSMRKKEKHEHGRAEAAREQLVSATAPPGTDVVPSDSCRDARGLLIVAAQFGQSASGDLRVTVRDSTSLPVACRVMLVSEANDISQSLQTNLDGESVAKRLPY